MSITTKDLRKRMTDLALQLRTFEDALKEYLYHHEPPYGFGRVASCTEQLCEALGTLGYTLRGDEDEE